MKFYPIIALVVVAAIMLLAVQFGLAEDDVSYSLSSPDGAVQVQFALADGRPQYSVNRDNKALILPSSMGFELKDAPDLLGPFTVVAMESDSLDSTWETVWGQEMQIRNHYNELVIHLQEESESGRQLDIIFRAFDDGVGFRYHVPEQINLDEVLISSEESEFRFSGDYTAWYQAADTIVDTWEHGFDTYERLYETSAISEIGKLIHTPATFITPDNTHIAIHEANLTDYAAMTLALDKVTNNFESHLVPWPDGVKVKTKAPFSTPWRSIQIADDAAELAASRIILNLNEPQKLADVSWIKPMKYMGVWWEMHMDKSTWHQGPKHGATTANTKRYIDFAAEHGIGGILVEGWNLGWEDWITNPAFSFTESYPDYDLTYLSNYARELGVEIIGHHETSGDINTYEDQMEAAFELLNDHDINAVKTGYVGPIRVNPAGQHHHGQYMVNHYRKVLEMAAEHKVAVVAHEPIKPTGLRRTFPNLLSQEAMRGMEYNAWSDGNPSGHTTILPFTMGLAGPLDYTPGIFKVNFDEYRKGNSTHTTVANQLALYVVIHSPVQMAGDFPEHYADHPAFEFIKNVPTTWAQSRVLDARIGEYVVTARKDRDSDDWYIGAISNEEARELEINLDFLDQDQKYVAQVYADGAGASFKQNPELMDIRSEEIEAGATWQLKLAAGGGQAIRLTPAQTNESKKTVGSGL